MSTARSIAAAWRARAVAGLAPALGRACESLARRVADAAPVATGELRDSVHATPVRSTPARISAAVVVPGPHALATEYGTARAPARPFFRPAIRAEVPRMKALIRRAAGR